jgi:hypothetical protein
MVCSARSEESNHGSSWRAQTARRQHCRTIRTKVVHFRPRGGDRNDYEAPDRDSGQNCPPEARNGPENWGRRGQNRPLGTTDAKLIANRETREERNDYEALAEIGHPTLGTARETWRGVADFGH